VITTYLRDSVVRVQPGALDPVYHEPTTPTETTIKARVDVKRHVVRDARGVEVVAEGTITMLNKPGYSDSFQHDGRVWTVLAISEGKDWHTQFWRAHVV
jgi:hypothetical protein